MVTCICCLDTVSLSILECSRILPYGTSSVQCLSPTAANGLLLSLLPLRETLGNPTLECTRRWACALPCCIIGFTVSLLDGSLYCIVLPTCTPVKQWMRFMHQLCALLSKEPKKGDHRAKMFCAPVVVRSMQIFNLIN